MRKILSLAANTWRLEFADRSNWIFFVVLPILFTFILGSVQGGGGGGGGSDVDNRIPLLVTDTDRSDLSGNLIKRLEGSEIVRPMVMESAAAEKAFVDGDSRALLIIPENFSETIRSGGAAQITLRKEASNTNVLAIEQAVQVEVSELGNALAASRAAVAEAERVRPFESEQARLEYFTRSLQAAEAYLADPPARVGPATTGETSGTPRISGTEQTSAGQMVTWVLINLLAAAEVLVGERVGGTLRRLVVTPTSKLGILAGKLLGRFSMGAVQMALLITFGSFALGVGWGRDPLAVALVAGAFGLCAVALGTFVSTLLRTRGQATGVVIFLGMMLAALGGAWWPLEITPSAYQTVAQAFPTTWAMRGFTDVIVRGQDIVGVLPEVGVLLGFSAIFFALGVWRFRYE
jgi:ABC-2 type transport system permease protein